MMCIESPHFVTKQPTPCGVHSAHPSTPSTTHTMTFFFQPSPQGQHYTQCPLLPVFSHLPPQVSIRERVSGPPFPGHFRDCIFWGSRGSGYVEKGA